MIGYGPFWARNGVLFRKPGSGSIGPTEALPAIKAGGYGWVAFDPKTGEWGDERRIARAQGLDVVAWTRVRTLDDLDTLVQAGKRWNTGALSVPIIPNLEIEDTRLAELMGKTLLAMSKAGKALVATDGWADPIGKWGGYRKWVGSVECFPQEDPRFVDVQGCLLHASAFFRAVVPMLGAYGHLPWAPRRKPVLVDYARRIGEPHIVFCGDDVEDWAKW